MPEIRKLGKSLQLRGAMAVKSMMSPPVPVVEKDHASTPQGVPAGTR